jgi:MSHA pilin protein MshC
MTARTIGTERSHGFTLTELLMIIVILGILAVFAGSRFGGGYAKTRAYYEQLIAQVTYARKTAIAQRLPVCVHVVAGQSDLYYAAAGGTSCPGTAGVLAPNGQLPFEVKPSDPTITGTVATFQFDALGRYLTSAGATPGAALVITVSSASGGSYAFTVERETGYVHP